MELMILLVIPPSPFLIEQKVYPSLGVLYLATYLRKHGIQCAVCDLTGEEDYRRLYDYKYMNVSLVGITATTPQFVEACKIAEEARGIFGCNIAIGGAHASVDPESCRDFEYVVKGEGELALLDYFNWFGRVVHYEPISHIDIIPYPDRRLIDIKSYKYYINGELATPVMTSRGCPYDCAFCCHVWGKRVRMNSAEYIEGEIKELKRLGYRAFMFFDDIFAVNEGRVRKIAEKLKALDIVYRCFARSDTCNENMLKMLRESGCVEIGFGAESGSQMILDIVGKHNSVENNTRLVESARKLGIRTKAFMIAGLPGETNETCQETYDWLNNVRPDDWDMSSMCHIRAVG